MFKLGVQMRQYYFKFWCFALISLPLQAQPVIDFYGKDIDLILPFVRGGGTEQHALFYAEKLPGVLPGQPHVKVAVKSGIASIKAANYFAGGDVEPNGLTLLATSASTHFPYLLDDPRVKYDYENWHIVLASEDGAVVYLPMELGEQWNADPESLIGSKYFIFGSQGHYRLDIIALLTFDMLGMDVEPIFGIKGRGLGWEMLKRGDVNIDYQTTSSYLANVKPLEDLGTVVPIMSFGVMNDAGDIVRDPNFPDLPTFKELYRRIKGEEPSGEVWEVWKGLFMAGFSSQKMMFLPKGTSQEIVDTYTRAFEKLFDEESFQIDSKKRLGFYRHVTGEKANDYLRRVTHIDPKVIGWIKRWVWEMYGVRL